MKKVEQFLVFRDEEIKDIIESFGLKIDEEGNIIDGDGNSVVCKICQTPLTVKNLGFVLHGSSVFICDNPACAIGYLAEKKQRKDGDRRMGQED